VRCSSARHGPRMRLDPRPFSAATSAPISWRLSWCLTRPDSISPMHGPHRSRVWIDRALLAGGNCPHRMSCQRHPQHCLLESTPQTRRWRCPPMPVPLGSRGRKLQLHWIEPSGRATSWSISSRDTSLLPRQPGGHTNWSRNGDSSSRRLRQLRSGTPARCHWNSEPKPTRPSSWMRRHFHSPLEPPPNLESP